MGFSARVFSQGQGFPLSGYLGYFTAWQLDFKKYSRADISKRRKHKVIRPVRG